MSGVSRRQWLLALAIAVLIHGGIAAIALRSPPDAGSIAAGAGGIDVALGPAGRAPGSVETLPPPTAKETADPVEELDEVTAAEQPPEDVLEDVEEIQAAQAGETVEAEALQDVDPDTPDVVTSDELETIEPETTMPTDIPDVDVSDRVPKAAIAEGADPPEAATTSPEPADVLLETLDPPLPRPAQATITEAADVTPEQVAVRSPDPEPVLPSPRKPSPPEPASPEPPAEEGAGGEAGNQADGDLGSGESLSGGGAAGARADYAAVLQAWLEQHKTYPRRALSRRLEGVVSLRFVMNREGRVLDYRIEQSSGHRLLDRAVTTLIERAQPLPAMPEAIKEASLTLVVPISFVLK